MIRVGTQTFCREAIADSQDVQNAKKSQQESVMQIVFDGIQVTATISLRNEFVVDRPHV